MDMSENRNVVKPATSYTSISLYDAVKLRIGKQGLVAAEPKTIPQHFRDSCEQYSSLPALAFEPAGTKRIDPNWKAVSANDKDVRNAAAASIQWKSLTYADYYQNVEQAALVLLHVGLQPRSSVGILAGNCPEWFYVALGALRANGVVAGIYPTSFTESVYHVLNTAEATVCLVDDAIQMAKVRSVRKRLPRLRAILQLNEPFDDFVGTEEGYYRWEDVWKMKFGDDLRRELDRRERDVGANECAMLIYTSGTTGMPKAAMLSHDGILYDVRALAAALPSMGLGTETVVSYLPLSHIAATHFEMFLPLHNGCCVYFADRHALKGSLGRYLVNVRPTCIFGVPRVFEKIQEQLTADLQQKSSAIPRYITQWAMETLQESYIQRLSGNSPSYLKNLMAASIARKLKSQIGFDRCKIFLVGGAPVSEKLKRFFLGIDIFLNELYGMTEATGCTNITSGICNLQTVGKALDSIEVKIHNPDGEGHGEISLRGRSIFMGYLSDAEKTLEAIKNDGWLFTGDIGYLDIEGNLYISGRAKEIIITSGGENIPPVRIEECIKSEMPFISSAMVVGDRRKYLTVLLTLKTEIDVNTGQPLDSLQFETVEWMRSLGLNFTKLSEALHIPVDNKTFDASSVSVKPHPNLVEAIEEGLKRVNKHAIANCQRVQKFAILPHDFSSPTGELGPTLKIRRNIVAQKYANIIEELYK